MEHVGGVAALRLVLEEVLWIDPRMDNEVCKQEKRGRV